MRDLFIARRSFASFIVGLFLACGALATTGCNTTEGAGKDIEATGDAIKDAAHDAKN
jgi:predicted small secreted protein